MTDQEGEILKHLVGLSTSTGRIEAQLMEGRRLHEWFIAKHDRTDQALSEHSATLREHRTLLDVLKEQNEDEDGVSPSKIKEWIEAAKDLWHIWGLAAATIWKMGHWLAAHFAF